MLVLIYKNNLDHLLNKDTINPTVHIHLTCFLHEYPLFLTDLPLLAFSLPYFGRNVPLFRQIPHARNNTVSLILKPGKQKVYLLKQTAKSECLPSPKFNEHKKTSFA